MRPLKVLTIIGTRPEAIKMAPVIAELRSRGARFECTVCTTGQHSEMLNQALESFAIRPEIDLKLMAPRQTLAGLSAAAIDGVDNVLADQAPDLVLVQGDTVTAFCGALAAFYRRIPVAHVEAGLRTGDRYAPFPEEMNRRLIGSLAEFHLAPTQAAAEALEAEGVEAADILVTGNTVVDALLQVRQHVRTHAPELPAGLPEYLLRDDMDGQDLVLVTAHRRENFGAPFEQICRAIRDVADDCAGATIVYPIHMNPDVSEPARRILSEHPRIHLIAPVSYRQFVWLMDRAAIVVTDSGGVQEEAPVLGKPVLVLREETERVEGVATGNAKLVGTDRRRIVTELTRLLRDPEARSAMATPSNPYGDGKASVRIVDALQERFHAAQACPTSLTTPNRQGQKA